MRYISHTIILIVCFIFIYSFSTCFAGWEVQTAPSQTKTLKGIWGSSAADVYAVGEGGTILHTTDSGLNWSSQVSSTTANINAIWGSSAADVYVVGAHGTILHTTDGGLNWFSQNSNTAVNISAIWGNSAHDIFAGGNGGIVHYDGSKWASMDFQFPVYGIWGSSAQDVFAGGIGGIVHYDGSNWSEINNNALYSTINDLWGDSATDVLAVGNYGSMARYNGIDWSFIPRHTTNDLYGVWGDSAADIIAVGQGGTILHYDGIGWSVVNSGTTQTLYGVWGSSESDVFAAGAAGTILHYDGDDDNDGIIFTADNCPYNANPGQSDTDNDDAGDVCDNCLSVYNPDQKDTDHDGLGDACDDSDSDGIIDMTDNCTGTMNPDQTDIDADGFGDVCDRTDRFAVIDTSVNRVFVFDMNNNVISTIDFSAIGKPTFIRAAGNSGWLLKGQLDPNGPFNVGGGWAIWHIDSSGALRNTFRSSAIGTGPFYTGLNNGMFITNDAGIIILYDAAGRVVNSTNVWADPDGWSYDYTVMGDVAGLSNGGFVLLPEMGTYFFGGAGFTPFIYFYDENLDLINKVDISSLHITIFNLAGLSNGGFAGLGNIDGGSTTTHLFMFNSSGNLTSQRDITLDINSRFFMYYSIGASNDGGVMVSELYQSKMLIYHSPPVMVDLLSKGVTSIGGIGGNYFNGDPIIDTDADGIPDIEDNCTQSNLETLITIQGCDTGVANHLFPDGCSMNDLLSGCFDDTQSRWLFMKKIIRWLRVLRLTIEWKREGVIDRKQAGEILRCTAKAN